jgi:hypothetical protein
LKIWLFSQQAVSVDIIPNSAVGIFSSKTEGKRHKQLGYTYELVATQIRSLKILGPLSNLKIQQKQLLS